MDLTTEERSGHQVLGRLSMDASCSCLDASLKLTFVLVTQLLATIGDQFQVGDEICGVVCSIRYGEDILSVWNRNPDNSQANLKIKYFLSFSSRLSQRGLNTRPSL